MVVLAVLQLALALHVRNTLTDCASEGARHGASARRSTADAEARTRQLISSAVSPRYAQDVSAAMVNVDGVDMVRVTVKTTMPLFGLAGGNTTMVVTGHGIEDAT